MAWVAAAAMIAGTLLQMKGQRDQAKVTQQQGAAFATSKSFEAEQLESNALQTQAAAQREAFEHERQARIVASRALAVAGASGAGVSDPTVMDVIADIDGVGALRKATAIYQGAERARHMRMAAAGARFEGYTGQETANDAADAGMLSALGSGIAGGGSLYSRYGMGGPAKTPVNTNAGALDSYELFSGRGVTDPRFG